MQLQNLLVLILIPTITSTNTKQTNSNRQQQQTKTQHENSNSQKWICKRRGIQLHGLLSGPYISPSARVCVCARILNCIQTSKPWASGQYEYGVWFYGHSKDQRALKSEAQSHSSTAQQTKIQEQDQNWRVSCSRWMLLLSPYTYS
jgi:hypothetical protein